MILDVAVRATPGILTCSYLMAFVKFLAGESSSLYTHTVHTQYTHTVHTHKHTLLSVCLLFSHLIFPKALEFP